ncbi:MAG: phosphoglucosamine mutase [Pseudanabaenaceae cyanobacterium bins.68]|nr:phosphoglucosamine mutase [Pseudanabaenaceae cyanobacterium bins.68]
MELFGTDGVRGKAGELLTGHLVLNLGYYAGLELAAAPDQVVLIGQDSRHSGPMLTAALTAGLNSAGLEVWQLGLCPTPTVAFLTATLPQAIAGIMVSASHNPPPDNGIKFFDREGIKLSPTVQAQISAALQAQTPWQSPQRWGKTRTRPDLLAAYQTAVVNSLDRGLPGFKVVLDTAWGAASEIAPQVFQQLGAEVICLHDRPDGDLINVDCGSTNLAKLAIAVQEHGAALGLGFDGDADRVLAVDELGQSVNGDYILYLWGKQLLEQQRLPDQAIVTTVMANLGFEQAWQKLGGQMFRTAVGDQYVHAQMLKSGAMLGGEQSGHVLCRHYGVSGDGLMTAIHLAALVQDQAPLSKLVEQSFRPFPQSLINVRVENLQKRSQWQNCESVMAVINQAEMDLGDRGRVLVRASGTEPLIRVMVEAEDLELVNLWSDRLVTAVKVNLT